MSYRAFKGLITAVIAVFVIIVGALIFVEKVPEGKVAVVYSPSDGATEVLNPGWHIIGLFEKTQEYPTRVTIVDTTISVTTNDGKKITMPVKYEMNVQKDKVLNIFKELGSQNIEQIQEGYLYQKLFSTSREVISGYSVLDIFGTKTTEASVKVTEKMAKASGELGFTITNVTLGNPEVDENTQKAIDARVQAAQQNELKKIELENAKLEAEKNNVIAQDKANQAVVAARGEAEANSIVNASITDNLLKRMELEARLKHGWVTISGATPLVEAK